MSIPFYGAEIVNNNLVKIQIVVPKNSNKVEQFAAKELAFHLKLITNQNIPIVNSLSSKIPQIRLGRAAKLNISQLPGNGALVKIGKTNIDISGVDGKGDALNTAVSVGTLFGVYEFLERELKVRWLWPGELGTIAPKKNTIILAESQYKVAPPMEFAVWRNTFKNAKNQGWYSPKNAKKFHYEKQVWLRRHRFNTLTNVAYGHAFTRHWKLYGKSNPEIFNLLPDNTRLPDKTFFNGRGDLISMCVSNPKLIQLIIKDWQKRGTNTIINLNENDTAGKCVCNKCIALDNNTDTKRLTRAKKRFYANDKYWYQELGSLSERYAAFYLAVQKEANKINPNSKMISCIYANYYEPPQKIKLNERIIMRFCPPIMYPWTDSKIAMFKRLWKGWADSGVSLMLRPNFTLDGHNFPLMYHRQFAECFDFARNNKLKFTDFDSLTGVFGTNGITCYVIAAKNYSGMNKNVSELETEYLAAFGKAKPFMKKWMELMISATNKGYKEDSRSVEGSSHYASFYEVAGLVFTPEIITRGRKLLAEAEKAVSRDKKALARVQFVRAGFEDAAIVLDVEKGVKHYRKTGEATPAAKAMLKLQKFRKENEHLGYCDFGSCYSRETRKWPMHLAMLGNSSRELRNWQIVFDPNNIGKKEQWFITPPVGKAISLDKHMENSDAYKAFFKNTSPHRIPGWYFNTLEINNTNPGQQLKLTFGALDGNAEIYLNGKLIHNRKFPHNDDIESWKKPFDIDVTGKIKNGKNLIAVYVTKDANFIGLSGIWKPVFISNSQTNVAPLKATEWKFNVIQGKFSRNNKKYPLQIICTEPAKNRNTPYKGVWGRFYKSEKVKAGKMYELQIRFKQKGDAHFETWVRSAPGSLSKNNINIPASNEKNVERTLIARFIAGTDNCTIFLNLLKGTGEVQIYSVKMYPASDL